MPTVEANGLTLAYESQGDPANPVVLLVMGLGANLRLWPDAFCDKLAAQGFHVVRLDNRDVGHSTKLDHLGVPNIPREAMRFFLRRPVRAPYRIDEMAQDTAAFIDALGLGKVHAVGASMGGMIVQNLAAQFPEKVLTVTSIMSTTGHRSLPMADWRALGALLQKPAKAGDTVGASKRLAHLLRTIGSKTHPAGREELEDLCLRHVERSSHAPGAMRQIAAIAASDDRSDYVRRIRAPLLVIHGEEDPLLKAACGRHTAQVAREAGTPVTEVIVKGMGHDLPRPLLDEIVGHLARHCK